MPVHPRIEAHEANNEVFIQIKNAPDATKRGIRNAFYLVGHALRKDSRRRIINGPKTGALYRIKGRENLHRASAPFESPANLFGKLQKAIGFQINGSETMDYGVREKVKYGVYLELGTDKMTKRPFLIRSIRKRQQTTSNYFNGELNKELNKTERA